MTVTNPPFVYADTSANTGDPNGQKVLIRRSDESYSQGTVHHIIKADRLNQLHVWIDIDGVRGKDIILRYIPEGADQMQIIPEAMAVPADKFEQMWESLNGGKKMTAQELMFM